MISRTRYFARALVAGLALAALPVPAADVDSQRTGGPYVPTPQVVVDEMLRMAKVGANDFVVDLGSGDGVIVLTAAQKFKARGFGVDIDPDLVKLSNTEARRLGVADRARFFVQDVFKTDISKATVVTLYLLPGMMVNLRPKIFGELRPGTRVVSHDYHFEEWMHDDELTFEVPEKELITGEPSATLYLWVVPARIGGAWRLQVDGNGEYDLTLQQSYQRLMGSAEGRGGKAGLLEPKIHGTELSFLMLLGADHRRFTGRVDGDRIEGTADFGGGRIVRWRATRNKTS